MSIIKVSQELAEYNSKGLSIEASRCLFYHLYCTKKRIEAISGRPHAAQHSIRYVD